MKDTIGLLDEAKDISIVGVEGREEGTSPEGT